MCVVHVCLKESLSNSEVGAIIIFAEWIRVSQGVSVCLGLWSLLSVSRSHSLVFKLGRTVSVKLVCVAISQRKV